MPPRATERTHHPRWLLCVFPELRCARQQIQTQHAQRMWSQAKAVKQISSRVTHWLVCVINSGVILGDRMKVIVCVGCHVSFSDLFSDRVWNEVCWVLIRRWIYQ